MAPFPLPSPSGDHVEFVIGGRCRRDRTPAQKHHAVARGRESNSFMERARRIRRSAGSPLSMRPARSRIHDRSPAVPANGAQPVTLAVIAWAMRVASQNTSIRSRSP